MTPSTVEGRGEMGTYILLLQEESGKNFPEGNLALPSKTKNT